MLKSLDLALLLRDTFVLLIETSEKKPTHFKIVRAAKSELIKLLPIVSDFHLDSYVLHFYRKEELLSTKNWWGTNLYGLEPNVLLPICELLNAKDL